MSDTVSVVTEVHYAAWATPDIAQQWLQVDGVDADPTLSEGVPVETLPNAVVDALAAQWLDHLYARLNRAKPFHLTAQPQDGGHDAG